MFIFDSAGFSHCGYVRKTNQDAILDAREHRLWAVADGMGGHSAGDLAAQIIIQELAAFTPPETTTQALQAITDKLAQANTRCQNLGNGTTSGSTVVALYCQAHYSFVVWSGDSRLYRCRDGQLQKLTKDHTVSQQLATQDIPREQIPARGHHVLTNAIGIRPALQVESEAATIQAGDIFLLCSDGLYRSVSRRRMRDILQQRCCDAAQSLLNQALRAGAKDNVSGIVIRVSHI